MKFQYIRSKLGSLYSATFPYLSPAKIAFAGAKIMMGYICVKVSGLFVDDTHPNTNAVTNPNSSVGSDFDFKPLYDSRPFTVSGQLEGIGQGLIISGSWDLVKIGFTIVENTLYKKKCTVQIEEEDRDEPVERPKNKKQKRRIENQLVNSTTRRAIAIEDNKRKLLNRKSQLVFLGNLALQALEGVMLSYFLISLIKPIKDWYDLDSINKGRNRLYEFLNSDYDIYPTNVIEKILLSKFTVFLPLGLFAYQWLRGKRSMNDSYEDSNRLMLEKPIEGVANSAAFFLLAESALMKHDRVIGLMHFFNSCIEYSSDLIGAGVALKSFAQHISEGLSPAKALFMSKIHSSLTMKLAQRNNLETLAEKALWLFLAKGISFYGKFKLIESLENALFAYLRSREENPLQTRMEAVRRAFVERPRRTDQAFILENERTYLPLLQLLPPSQASATATLFAEEVVDEEARQRKRQEREAREERAKERNEKTSKDRDAKEAGDKKNKDKDEILRLKKELMANIQTLNPTGLQHLNAIMRKGKHLGINDKEIQQLFGAPNAKPNLLPFKLKAITDGVAICFNGEQITTYDRQHNSKWIHEGVFNKIREKFEFLGITVDDLEQNVSLSNSKSAAAI